jgi:hypothetical protein
MIPRRSFLQWIQTLRIYAAGRGAILCGNGVLLTSLAGCSVFFAATQPPRKNLGLLAPGTPRSALIAEFGVPARSRLVNFNRVDVFSITQGYSKGARAGRALVHGTADVLTGGLWELAGTPAEMYFEGENMTYEVSYDAQDRVLRVSRLNN